MNSLLKRRLRVKKRVRSKVQGTADRPRINVFRSNNYMYAQAIDDVAAKTLAAASDRAERKTQKLAKKESAAAVGKALAEKLVAMKISEAVFDRGYYKYTGRVQAVADAMREAKITI